MKTFDFLLFIYLFEQNVVCLYIDWNHEKIILDDFVKLWKLLILECNKEKYAFAISFIIFMNNNIMLLSC
jgi:hypothetical protein